MLRTRYKQMTSGALDGYSNFMGDDSEYRDWFGFIGQHRDSAVLERSNFACAVADLEEVDPSGEDWRVESFGHWGVGWIEEVYVRPGTPCADYAESAAAALADYPVLSDSDFSEREYEEALQVWQNCYDNTGRANYIRANRSQFEPYNLQELYLCVKGEVFIGYAGELIS